MKTVVISAILMASSLGVFGKIAATPQYEGHSTNKGPSQKAHKDKQGMSHDHMMAKEPHHALAMAYRQNLAAFAKALHEQSARAGSIDVEFARVAVAEMRRSFDQMKQHHQSHMQTMSAEMRTKMSGMMQRMEMHQTELNTQLTALEEVTKLSAPDGKKVSTLAASVHAHLGAMSKMHQGSKMKMKM